MRTPRSSTGVKLVVSGGLLALVTAGVGGAAFASFTASTNAAANTTATGTVSFADISTNGTGQRLSVGATNLAPGDSLQRAVDLQNTGSQDLASIVLSVAAATSSALDTDATDGLQVAVDRCSVAWTESGSAPACTYTCGGSTTSVLAARPVIGTNLALSGLTSLTAGQTDHLRFTVTFPSTAGNAFQNLTSALTWTFTATQRTAAAH